MALRASIDRRFVNLVAVAACQPLAMVLFVRIVRTVLCSGRKPLARRVVARLVQTESVVEAPLLKRQIVSASHPSGAFGQLLAQRRHMTSHARNIGTLVHCRQKSRILRVISFHVRVHRRMADSVAETRLFVPHPEPRSGHNQNRRRHAHGNPPARARATLLETARLIAPGSILRDGACRRLLRRRNGRSPPI